MSILNQILTGKDNHTHDLAKWTWLGGFFAVVGAALYQIAMGHTISLMEIATSLGIVSGAGSASVAGKQLAGAEPEPK
jgi:O6-methylguanine-DNA--protein-cysteine methyltransferase